MRCGFLFSKSGMLFVIIGLWFFCGLFFRFYNFELEKFKCQTYRSHVIPCGLRGLRGLRGMLLSHTLSWLCNFLGTMLPMDFTTNYISSLNLIIYAEFAKFYASSNLHFGRIFSFEKFKYYPSDWYFSTSSCDFILGPYSIR